MNELSIVVDWHWRFHRGIAHPYWPHMEFGYLGCIDRHFSWIDYHGILYE
jgi:hypothetical protein